MRSSGIVWGVANVCSKTYLANHELVGEPHQGSPRFLPIIAHRRRHAAIRTRTTSALVPPLCYCRNLQPFLLSFFSTTADKATTTITNTYIRSAGSSRPARAQRQLPLSTCFALSLLFHSFRPDRGETWELTPATTYST